AKEKYSQLQKRFYDQETEFSKRLEEELKHQQEQLESQSSANQTKLTTSIEDSRARETIFNEQINTLQQKLQIQNHEQEIQIQELEKLYQQQLSEQLQQQ
uniref:hypothetical protein n=1 Tax=Salmonella sp. s51228 TaxID=3159652 RepID=UPI00397F9880